MTSPLFYTVISFVLTAFGNGLQPISIAALFQPTFQLLSYGQLVTGTPGCWLWGTFVFVAVHSFASTVAFLDMFSLPTRTSSSIETCLGTSLCLVTVVTVFVIMPVHIFHKRFPFSPYISLVLPALFTSTYSVIGLVFGAYLNPGVSFLDYGPLVQSASLFGLHGITFVATWIASFAYIYISGTSVKYLRQNVLSCTCIVFLILGYGGARAISQTYMTDLQTQIGDRVQVSCLLAEDLTPGTPAYQDLWDITLARIAAQDAIILWAEESVSILTDDDEVALQMAAVKALEKANNTYLGVAYEKFGNPHSNKFLLYGPEGLVWDYSKAHTVPIVEANITAGPATIPIEDTPFGRLGGAICYDMDFPLYIRQAGEQGVDIMLQPSWTWSAMGERHFYDNALRAVENGFTLFRCSSDGISGIVSPYHRFWSTSFSGVTDQLTFTLPLQKSVTTVYVLFGWLFEWVCLACSCLFWITVLLPGSYVQQLTAPATTFFGSEYEAFEAAHPQHLYHPL